MLSRALTHEWNWQGVAGKRT